VTTADLVAIIGAGLGGISGLVGAWAALTKARQEGNADCQERITQLRAESEHMADELHELRMKRANE